MEPIVIRNTIRNKLPVFLDKELTIKTTLKRIGCGGSKSIYVVENKEIDFYIDNRWIHDLVIVLPNTDVDSDYSHWFPKTQSIVPMYRLESEISKTLNSYNVLTPEQRETEIFIEYEDKIYTIGCFVSNNFSILVKKGIYVIDNKNFLRDSMKEYGDLWTDFVKDLITPNDWHELLSVYIQNDIPVLYKLNYPTNGDSVNFCISENKFRFFGFDFSSKTSKRGVIDIKNTQENKEDFNLYKLKCIRIAVEAILFCEYHIREKNKCFCLPKGKLNSMMRYLFLEDLNIQKKIEIKNKIKSFTLKHILNQRMKSIDEKLNKIDQINKNIQDNLNEFRKENPINFQEIQKENPQESFFQKILNMFF
jgi:hypothetical protein